MATMNAADFGFQMVNLGRRMIRDKTRAFRIDDVSTKAGGVTTVAVTYWGPETKEDKTEGKAEAKST